MATIDSNIAMGYKPVQIENPLNQLAAMTQIQAGQQGQQLNALKLQEAQLELEDRNKLRGLDINSPDFISNVSKFNPKLALTLQKDLAAYKKSGLETTELQGKISKQEMDRNNQNLRNLSRNPSNANIQAYFEDFVLDNPNQAQKIANAQRTRDYLLSADIPTRNAYLSSIGATAGELKPTIKDTDIGGSILPRVLDPYSGLPISTGKPIAKTATPGELLVDKRTREAVDRGERRDIVASTSTAADGTVTQFNKFGEVINRITAAGKPSATFEKTAALQKQQAKDLNLAITEIENAIKPGGLLEKSTGSGAGKLRDAAGNFIGYATEGSIAAASLKPIADLGLKMIPRFEGPQSDKDTATYKEAAGELANESLPVARRQAAAKTVVRLMKGRKGQFVNDVMATEGIGAAGIDTSNPLLK